jgi:single-stranded-DNA-specific exonuclease
MAPGVVLRGPRGPHNGAHPPVAVLPPIDEQRWQLPRPLHGLGSESPAALAGATGLQDELIAVLLRRGHSSAAAINALLQPAEPPPPAEHFRDLGKAVKRLRRACRSAEALAICGDYDADGMTSTALLVGVLQRLGARPVAAIPSRMDDGYGLNTAMVERLANDGIRLLITVDNGVSACAALERAQQLGVEVILTDHHTLPPQLPPHLALLHPAVTPEGSPYRGLAGVGLAYVLARALCENLGEREGLAIALNLFCIGTIADMAPLLGVNRAWLMGGLPQLAASPLPGLKALLQLSGVEPNTVGAQAVGFQLAPRINAVGRLGDPALVVELLTTDDDERALELARQCDQLNRQRRELCDAIEAEALALLDADGEQRSPFVLIAQNHWHHGVIGIVAARLVERFGRPVALAAGEGDGRLRASARAPRGFAIDQALHACSTLLERFGGHPAAGGFSVRAEHLGALHERLNSLASTWLREHGSGLPVEPEALLRLERIDLNLWKAQQRLEPFGIGHPAPVFWSRRCQVLQQSRLRGGHLQVLLGQGEARIRALGWRWQGEAALPEWVDVAYRLVRDHWQGRDRLQLELVGLRPAAEQHEPVMLLRQQRRYWCTRQGDMVVIRNAEGRELCHPVAELQQEQDAAPEHPYLRTLISEAAVALGLAA